MRNRLVTAIVMAMFTLALAACSRAEAPPPGSHGAHGKVYFVQPKNGATINRQTGRRIAVEPAPTR